MNVPLKIPLAAAVLVVSATAGAMRMLHVHYPVPIQDAVIGTLRTIDHRNETITVSTPMGVETLILPASAAVHQGAHALTTGDLTAHANERVKVWFRTVDGRRVATEVRLAAPAVAVPSAGTGR
jgi:hypothetical protein